MAGQLTIKQIAQEVISEVNQPLYIGGKLADGSDAKITVASNGNVSTATPLTVPSLTVNSKPVMSSLLAEYTVTGSAVTSIDFSGLDINTHKSYRVEMEIYNPTASAMAIQMYVNGDTTSTNYYSQYHATDGTLFTGSRANGAYVFDSASGVSNCGVIFIHKTNGYPRAESFISTLSASAVQVVMRFYAKTATVTNITQLTFTAGVANSIGVGSTIRLYRGDV